MKSIQSYFPCRAASVYNSLQWSPFPNLCSRAAPFPPRSVGWIGGYGGVAQRPRGATQRESMPQVNPAPSLDQAQPQLLQLLPQEAAATPMDASPPPAPAPAPTEQEPDTVVTPTSPPVRPASPGGGAAADGGASQSHRVSVCQVDDCGADLARSKLYHRRHRVCETHFKSSGTLVAGHTQRFCQLCSRFHGLPEFDGYMRSCRRRLAGRIPRRIARRIARLPPGFRGAI